ncbi:hypothetical protein [Caudoviricetes sp.]|nr:hypothetical protein [Caudoviricetes sp.]UOF81034.1 hypothetical protein [Caudoviricetes sp.]UOF81388.1 hypothetical protein [Caudoviricetes sp.]
MAKFFSQLNREEMLYGAGFGLLPSLPFAFLTVPACAVLWALGGAPNKSAAYRTVGCPFAVLIATMIVHGTNLMGHGFAAVAQYGLLTLGYGIPTSEEESPGHADKGSVLGRFFYKLTNKNHKLADILTRGTIFGALLAVYFLVPKLVEKIL